MEEEKGKGTRPGELAGSELLQRKFGYVVACQVYGKMRKNQDSKVGGMGVAGVRG